MAAGSILPDVPEPAHTSDTIRLKWSRYIAHRKLECIWGPWKTANKYLMYGWIEEATGAGHISFMSLEEVTKLHAAMDRKIAEDSLSFTEPISLEEWAYLVWHGQIREWLRDNDERFRELTDKNLDRGLAAEVGKLVKDYRRKNGYLPKDIIIKIAGTTDYYQMRQEHLYEILHYMQQHPIE